VSRLPAIASLALLVAAAAPPELPATRMTTRGKLVYGEDFAKDLPPCTGSTARFASGFAGWRFNVEKRGGHWDVVDGTFKGAENAEHHHPATASYGFDFKDAIIQCDVRLNDVPPEGRKNRYFNLRTTDSKDYVCSIILTESGMRIQKDDNDHDGPDVAVPLGRLKTPIPLGEWQTIVMEILGDEMVGTLNGKSLTGRHSLLASEKKSIMFVSGTECSVRNLRIWEATAHPDWATTKGALQAEARTAGEK